MAFSIVNLFIIYEIFFKMYLSFSCLCYIFHPSVASHMMDIISNKVDYRMSEAYLLFRKRLAEKRNKLKLTLQALADRSGVSKSIISKIEHGQVQPTIETASRIAQGLNTSLSAMLLTELAGSVIHHPADQQFTFDGGTHRRRIVTPAMRRSCIEVFQEQLDQGASTDSILFSDAEKYILAIEGGLTVKANVSEYSLGKGDCLHLEKDVAHSLKNTANNKIQFITILHRKEK
jgi:transcriptional regulator with XRE-family HTH domain